MRYILCAALAVLLLGPGVSSAAWETSAIQNKDAQNLLGANTAGTPGSCSGGSASSSTNSAACTGGGGTWTAGTSASRSGVYELRGVVQTAIPVILGISFLWVGWSVARRVVVSFRRS